MATRERLAVHGLNVTAVPELYLAAIECFSVAVMDEPQRLNHFLL